MDSRFRGNDKEGKEMTEKSSSREKLHPNVVVIFILLLFLIVVISVEKFH